MIKEEISFRCPLCNQKFFAKGIHRHLKKNHPKISKVEFILLLRKAENSGIKVVEKSALPSLMTHHHTKPYLLPVFLMNRRSHALFWAEPLGSVKNSSNHSS